MNPTLGDFGHDNARRKQTWNERYFAQLMHTSKSWRRDVKPSPGESMKPFKQARHDSKWAWFFSLALFEELPHRVIKATKA